MIQEAKNVVVNKLKVNNLKAILRQFNLKIQGNKPELVARILSAIDQFRLLQQADSSDQRLNTFLACVIQEYERFAVFFQPTQ